MAVAQMQQRILKVFKSGELNVLVATAVAEEGLDIVHCSLVVRFNLAPTARQFIQSRGRARAQGSAMALMLEHGAEAHQKLVGDALKSGPCFLPPSARCSLHAPLLRNASPACSRGAVTESQRAHPFLCGLDWWSCGRPFFGLVCCRPLNVCPVSSPDQQSDVCSRFEEEMLAQAQGRAELQGPDEEGSSSGDTHGIPKSDQEYVVPSTGAKVTLADAKSLLYRFCNRLPSDRCEHLLFGAQLCPALTPLHGHLQTIQRAKMTRRMIDARQLKSG